MRDQQPPGPDRPDQGQRDGDLPAGDGWVRVRVPATSANLGPGFDALGLSLARYDEVAARASGDGVRVVATGEGAGAVPTDDSHLVAATALTTLDRLGGRPRGLELRCTNRIPHARGLGSSSAAIVAGILLGAALAGTALPTETALRWAAAAEGHPDNVAPCLYGGATIAWIDDAGTAHAVRLDPVADLHPVALIPAVQGRTAQARALLPAQVPHADAAATAGRAALLVHALTAAPELLLPATEDRLHQRYREPAMPASLALVGALRTAGLPAVLSGAGPTVLALLSGDVSAGQERLGEAVTEFGPGFVTLPLAVDATGARVCN
ncbi:homoserine kinase [Actinocatenispora thailandica]|uniref:Homoserine kinase n=1 Tax=Actinocatenispora thailandica TaxID=227318 RepID=A0A7R7DQW3_9ACTN|nr:homoserine kinase [Actinocatenispora thailandica]BCJ36086.1 homoserine kinase [Actinocatenispora thailandica]